MAQPRSTRVLTEARVNELIAYALRTRLSGAGGGGAIDHGSLTGLGDDDHTQYMLAAVSPVVANSIAIFSGTGGRLLDDTGLLYSTIVNPPDTFITISADSATEVIYSSGIGTAFSPGRDVRLRGGSATGALSMGGKAIVQAGVTGSSGNGQQVEITGANAVGGNRPGGPVVITGGNATGTGKGGGLNVNVGTSPSGEAGNIDLNSTTVVIVPRGTTAQQPAAPTNGMMRYDTTTDKFVAREAGAWVNMIGGAGGGLSHPQVMSRSSWLGF